MNGLRTSKLIVDIPNEQKRENNTIIDIALHANGAKKMH